VLADAGLDGGLLVGGDHELVGPQRGVAEAAGVEVEDAGRLGTEVGVAGEDPAPMLPRLDRIRTQPAPDGGARDRGDDARLDGGAGQVGTLPTSQRRVRLRQQFAGQRLDSDHDVRGKTRGPSSPRQIGQAGQTLVVEAFAPLGHHLPWRVQAGRDLVHLYVTPKR
jgi:hypothetical protein